MPAVATASTNAGSDAAGPSYQPFKCEVCQKRFTRHENLKRHATMHEQAENNPTIACQYCETTFARPDLLRRHQKLKHAALVEVSGSKSSSSKPAVATSEPSRASAASTSPPLSVTSATAPGQNTTPPSLSHNPPVPPPGFAGPAPSTSAAAMEELAWDFDSLTQSSVDAMLSTSFGSGTSDLDEAFHLFHGLPHTGETHPSSADIAPQPPVLAISKTNSQATGYGSQAGSSASAGLVLPTASNAQSWHPHSPRAHCCSPEAHNPGMRPSWYPTSSELAHGVDLFFYHVAHFVPFLHQPTFDASVAAEHLVFSMACLGYQYGDDPSTSSLGDAAGNSLSNRCFRAACELVSRDEDRFSNSSHKLVLVQSHLLLQIHAMLYLSDADGADGLSMHARMIRLSRSSGLMQPLPTDPNATSDLESLWRQFIKTECHKRTMLSLHHVDSLWYQVLSVPRSISHLEIKHELPAPESLWTTTSASEWAHRTLTANSSAPVIRYSDAIRRFISPPENAGPLPQLELQGALNLIHFLRTSLREVSGWSAITGRVSLERFDALNASLSATKACIRSREDSASDSQWLMVEATWQMAMLETLSWSAPHMGGIVEVSVDAALATAAHLAATQGFVTDPDIAHSIIAHSDWFLHYLETSTDIEREPPIITIYSFKAFLIAWQLLRSVAPTAMNAVGILAGDSAGALEWAMNVFQRRARWKVGSLIVRNLQALVETENR